MTLNCYRYCIIHDHFFIPNGTEYKLEKDYVCGNCAKPILLQFLNEKYRQISTKYSCVTREFIDTCIDELEGN